MPDWFVEVAKQVPSLGVLVILVVLFIRALRDMAIDGKAALNDAHETTASVVEQFTTDRKETMERLERIADNAHTTARETHAKFADAIDEMKTIVIEIKSMVHIR